MIQYILECIAFQLVFLVIYDFFLKRETFFQWNRVYLIATYSLSLLLPWIKIDAFSSEVPRTFQGYSEFLWNLDQKPILLNAEVSQGFSLAWQEWVFIIGALFSFLWFLSKLWRLHQLRSKGTIDYFKNFTQILVQDSHVAFSFFKSIFLGDQLPHKEYNAIISHELVHIKQRHSLDLLFFELMRIGGWFNPLVYVYQHRIAELHEFIADAHVPKEERKAHYELLLSQVFQTQHISFVNQFFKTSLIKKRIVMLQKSKSKKIWQLKYLTIVPVLLGMLLYTSCQTEISSEEKKKSPLSKKIEALELEINNKDSLTQDEKDQLAKLIYNTFPRDLKGLSGEKGEITYSGIPFAVVDEVPVFPGCENLADKRACFNERIQKHISKNFNYPQEAQDKGIQGRVNVVFTIQKDGSIGNVKMRGPDRLLENEVARIIKRLPKMTAGQHKGESVDVPFSIPVTFKLK
ncbi:M56 family peptidase [Maribacter sp. MJ134]|uniref:M56 family metallopeptidase n=1 Tax=Maribacter sp. MJ134 TaxID=2496865 RepID=UPI000F829934|nr:M56 family metallopeptidase [Maribacter sp. MJ134]AZQ59257.1 M56 family peptidase [Maribacter sp. MJ134]